MSARNRVTENTAMINPRANLLIAALVFGAPPAWAQPPGAMPSMDHSDVHGRTSAAGDRTSEAAKMGHGSPPPAKADAAPTPAKDAGRFDHSSMQGGDPPPDARDPHAYSGGYTLDPSRPLRMGDEQNFGSLLVDRLEACARATTASRPTSCKVGTAGTTTAWCSRPRARLMAASFTMRAPSCSGATP